MPQNDNTTFKIGAIARALLNPIDCVYNFGIGGIMQTVLGQPVPNTVGWVFKDAMSNTTYSNANLPLTLENRDAPIDEADELM